MLPTRFGIHFGSRVAVMAALSVAAAAQSVRIVEFPDPGAFYQNTSFVIDRGVGYVPTFDADVLWSFSVRTGVLLDPDGLLLPAPGQASDPFLFPGNLLAIPGWFPTQGVFVADISDPANLKQVGVIPFASNTNIQGQQIAVDANGYIGYIASYPNDTLYSFNLRTMQLEDPDGLALPGNPDRIAVAGNRLAMADTLGRRIMVADVSDPANMALAGTIDLPGGGGLFSNDTIVFAADQRTGYIATDARLLFSFDVQTLALLDPDGVAFGTQGGSYGVVIHGDGAAVPWDRGLTFFDISNPAELRIVSNGDFGGTVAPQGNATVAFSRDGTRAAFPVIFPGNYVYTFEVETGSQFLPRYTVSAQPNYLTIFGPSDKIGVLCSGGNTSKIWLIDGLLGRLMGDLNCDGVVNFGDINPFVLALSDPEEYRRQYPDCDAALADANHDGQLDFGDINAFVELLSG